MSSCLFRTPRSWFLRACALASALVIGLLAAVASAQQAGEPVPPSDALLTDFATITGDARVQAALLALAQNEPETIAEQIRLTQIPAPPFMEQVRAEYFLAQMQQRGLVDAYIDEEGNVIGVRPGSGNGPLLAIAAHLDTVFPAETDTQVELRDGRYYAPGISDDGRGLTVLLAVLQALEAGGIQTEADIMFIANVGEEGLGDLRGIKAIFRNHPGIDGFVSIDGSGIGRLTTGGTGSRRFEFIFTGPGGHSYSAFGLVSAIHAMGRAIAKIADLQVPSEPRTTFTVGTVRGGTSVNSIAAEAAFELDLRSNDAEELARLEERAITAGREAVAEENARWNGNGEISLETRLIGDRPVGRTPAEHALVQAAGMAFSSLGVDQYELRFSSTDSNIPMSLGIPAITIGGGGLSGGEHSPQEWFAPEKSHLGPQMTLLLVLAMAGMEGLVAPLLQER